MLLAMCALFAVVACEEQAPSPHSEDAPTPTPTPIPTAAVAEQFSADAIPLPGKEWLSKFSHMLSVVPANHGPVLFLDMKELRYKPDVQEALRFQIAPALAAIPSAVTNVIEGAVLATSGKDGGALQSSSTSRLALGVLGTPARWDNACLEWGLRFVILLLVGVGIPPGRDCEEAETFKCWRHRGSPL